jgi:acylphosphatase
MLKHYTIKVSGKVQGVFFRASTQVKAEELGVKGIVKNERDESVYIEAEAEEEILKQFVAWCQRGPERAKVVQCNIQEGPIKNYSGFKIVR